MYHVYVRLRRRFRRRRRRPRRRRCCFRHWRRSQHTKSAHTISAGLYSVCVYAFVCLSFDFLPERAIEIGKLLFWICITNNLTDMAHFPIKYTAKIFVTVDNNNNGAIVILDLGPNTVLSLLLLLVLLLLLLPLCTFRIQYAHTKSCHYPRPMEWDTLNFTVYGECNHFGGENGR